MEVAEDGDCHAREYQARIPDISQGAGISVVATDSAESASVYGDG